jgi:aspartyl-tRNA(Asn)/glutamyl-tRNA(Gln) amidotransferase subunit C
MKIDDAIVDKIAGLAKLEFEGESKEEIKADLNKMIDFVDKLGELDTDNVEPLLFVTEGVNVLRPDVVAHEVPHDDALKNGPSTDTDYFRVPKVLDQAED